MAIDNLSVANSFFHARKEIEMEEYINLLKKALAAETETVRLYTALMALAPKSHIDKFLELNADETDHQAIIADLLLEAAAGQSADQVELVPGVE